MDKSLNKFFTKLVVPKILSKLVLVNPLEENHPLCSTNTPVCLSGVVKPAKQNTLSTN